MNTKGKNRLLGLGAALLALCLVTPCLAAGKFLSIGTSKIGGTWYPIGAGIAEVVGPKLPGTNISVEETAGADENARRVASGDMEVGLTVARSAQEAYNGEGAYKGKPKSVLAWFSLEERFQTSMALEGSGIKTAADIKGKRVGIGIQGGANFFDGKIWLWGHGVELEDVQPFFMGQQELCSALKDGRIDVMLWTTGVPSAAIQELCMARKITFLPTTKEAAEKIHKTYPYYHMATLAAGSYHGMAQPYQTLVNKSVLVLNPKLSDDTVYTMTAAVFSNLEKLGTIHPVFKALSLDNAINTVSIPLHPGALRYFQEKHAKGVERFK